MSRLLTTLPPFKHVSDFDPDHGPYPAEGGPAFWTGDAPPAEIGRTVVAMINNLGPAEVRGYFVDKGFLALGVVLARPPAWYLAQGATMTTITKVFGAEVATRGVLASRRRRLAELATRAGMLTGAYMAKLVEDGLSLPLFRGTGRDWIAEGEDGQLYVFPAEDHGWERRLVFAGASPGIERSVSPVNAIGTGWPGAPGLAPDAPLPA